MATELRKGLVVKDMATLDRGEKLWNIKLKFIMYQNVGHILRE
jgi:hypothetical protein